MFPRITVLSERLAAVAVQTQAVLAGKCGGSDQQLAAGGGRGTGSEEHLGKTAWRRIVVGAVQPCTIGHDLVGRLDGPSADEGGRRVHAAATAVETHAEHVRRGKLRGKVVAAATRYDVMMIGSRRAAREHHFRQRQLRAQVEVLRGKRLPEAVHGGEPRQER